ncbi:MAG: acetate--CoA ligase family protein [Marinobacterium sp.]|nr:acetate--CoA ligase family protein [Marinobacterium sp.]
MQNNNISIADHNTCIADHNGSIASDNDVQSVRQANLQRLMKPRSMVFIGGSNLSLPIENTRRIGFDGEIWVVNPKHEQIAGIRCFRSVAELPGIPDAAFVAVNADATVQMVSELRAQGCAGVVCYAAGFAEVGNQHLQDALIDAAGEMALVGPNCYGLLNFMGGVALWPDRLYGNRPAGKGVAIISQSGNIALNLTMHDRSVPITHVISVGNQAVLGVGDYIEPLLQDEQVAAIGFYIEGLKDIEGFSRAALKALQKGVPLVVLKAGTSELGTQLTLSHTSSLAGSDDLYQAMFDRLGILRVDSLSQLLETLKVVALCEEPAGNRVGVLTCSGGDSALLADALDQYQLPLPPLNNAQQNALADWLPDFASLSNPLDYNTAIWGNLDACTEVFSTLMGGDYDNTLLALDFPKAGEATDTEWQVATDAMIAAHKRHGGTAAVISNLTELLPADARQRLADAGIAPLQGLQDGVAALAAYIRFSERRREVLAMDDNAQLLLRQGSLNAGSSAMLDEWASKQLMSSYRLPVPAGRLAQLDEVADVADAIGYPLVIKGVSDQLAHKTEAGAVALNIRSREDAINAATEMSRKLAAQGFDNVPMLLEPMFRDAVGELIIGLKRDEQFGLALIVGSGGILVNLMNDSQTLLLPTRPETVRQAVQSLRGYKLLQGYRGRPVADMDAIVDAVMAVADFAMEHWDSVLELDINPLMVGPQGQGAVAVDAMVRLNH